MLAGIAMADAVVLVVAAIEDFSPEQETLEQTRDKIVFARSMGITQIICAID